ncbi:phosphoribosylaminoimidazolesuccinocarboxamide synthase [uncultured Roseobacter sp.]|uniref:phosphoribosylaminoimidazolesuccinocarboxamide synthase n=1 Tax=uncultured Roseobacter sp. TaxID=114847 RepID=UPI00260F68BF|nr:phosphoribosylaminoimidazolesuccinocarboxamide synthase [uncultured Roseobacter sp.]
MDDEQMTHEDIRVFKMTADGPIVETSDGVIKYPSLEMRTLPGKAALATAISVHLHEFLRQNGVNTHFADRKGTHAQLVFETVQLPFDLLLRNTARGDLVSDFGLAEGHRLIPPLVEFFVRPDSRNKTPTRVSESHLLAFDLIDPEDIGVVVDMALRINDLLTGAFFGIGVRLDDVRMEFGAHFVEGGPVPVIMLVSELSPDVMCLQDQHSGDPLDHRLAFAGAGDGLRGYTEIMRRFDLDSASAVLARQDAV